MYLTKEKIRGLLNVWSLCGLLLLLCTIVLYVRWSGFGEQGEVNFATVSWLLYQGYPVYTDVDFAARYSLQHGPIVYFIAGGLMKLFGPSYITAKLSGILAVTLSIGISWAWFSKLIGKQYAFLLVGLETWILFHWHHIYFIRPDSMMLLCVVVGMYIITTKEKGLWLILGLAIPLAVMANLKIHGILYFLPLIAIAYERLGLKKLLYTGGLTLLLVMLPFLVPQVSLNNYIMWLSQSLHHGFSFRNFLPKIYMVLVLFLIPITIGTMYGVNMRSLYLRNRSVILASLFSLTVISIIASKGGSGTNHIMPFVPIFSYFIALIISEVKERDNGRLILVNSSFSTKLSSITLMLILVIMTASGIATEGRFLKLIATNDRRAIVQDVQSIEKVYSGKTIEIGYGEDKSYDKYRDLIPLPVFHGNPFLIEAVALADMNVAGLPVPPGTIKSLEEGTIQVFLIPVGDSPFAMSNGSTRQLFSELFRQTFLNHYHVISSTSFFDIWVYGNEVDGTYVGDKL